MKNTSEDFNTIAKGVIKALGCKPTEANIEEMAWYLAFFYKTETQPIHKKP